MALPEIFLCPKRFWKCLRNFRKCQNAFFSLAELPQMPKRSFFDLRNFRKCQNVFFSLAELPQMPKHSFFDLRNFRKPLKVVFRFAELPQALFKRKIPRRRVDWPPFRREGGSDPKKNPVIPYFSGTASRVATSRRHDFSTEAMPTASSGECGCLMSGPNEIMSMSG